MILRQVEVYSLDFTLQNRELLRSKTAMTWRSSGDGSPTLAGVENRPAHRLGACAQPLRGSSASHPLTLPLCLSNANGNQNRSHFFAENMVLGWREPRRRRGRWAKPSLRGYESVPRTVGSRGREGAQPPAEGG